MSDWEGIIPIYLNNRNWLTSTRALGAWFDDVPGTEVIIIDNASTYPPLLDWYETDCPHQVIRLSENAGKHALYHQKILLPPADHRRQFGSEFYVLSDPDLSLERCPKDLLAVLIDGLRTYPDVAKAGPSLELRDLPKGSPLAAVVRRWERRFWQKRRDQRFWEAPLDTTLALYAIETPPRRAKSCRRIGLRSDRPYTARHLPWYLTPETMTEEDRFYIAHSGIGQWARSSQFFRFFEI